MLLFVTAEVKVEALTRLRQEGAVCFYCDLLCCYVFFQCWQCFVVTWTRQAFNSLSVAYLCLFGVSQRDVNLIVITIKMQPLYRCYRLIHTL